MIPVEIRRGLLEFRDGLTSPDDFRRWIAETPGLENAIGRTAYSDLRIADYNGRDLSGVRELCGHLLDAHHPGYADRARVRRTLESMLSEDARIPAGLQELVRLHRAGVEFIPIIFVGFDSEIEWRSPPKNHKWHPMAFEQQRSQLSLYRDQIRAECARLRKALSADHPEDDV